MNKYESLYIEEKGKSVSTAAEAITKLQDLTWEDAYWIAKILYVYGAGTVEDNAVISSLDKAFAKGLNYHSNPELYLDAAQMMARLYMKYKRYDEAINFLMSIDELSDTVLDWVHLYYALAQVMSNNITRIAQKPKFFFERLDKVSEKSIAKRNEVFITYLQRITDYLADGTLTEYAKDAVDAKKEEYKLTERWSELSSIEDTDDDDSEITEPPVTIPTPEPEIKTVEVKVVDETKIKELESIISSKDIQISELTNKVSTLESLVATLREENEKLRADSSNKDKALTQIRTSIQENKATETTPVADITEFDNNGHALLNKYQTNQKILVIGALVGSGALDQLKLRAKHKGFDVEKDFEFITDYDKITNITGQLNYSRYAAIIAGPMGHSAAGNDGYSSFIEKLKGEGYPTLYEAKTESGKLKLNQSSFERALQKIISYLLVM